MPKNTKEYQRKSQKESIQRENDQKFSIFVML